MKVVSKLQRTSGVAELQEVGDQLVKMVRELEDSKRRNIQSSIDMLKQEILEAKGKVFLNTTTCVQYQHQNILKAI